MPHTRGPVGHEGHVIVRDHFAELTGVSGGSPDKLYCLTCKEPVQLSNRKGAA